MVDGTMVDDMVVGCIMVDDTSYEGIMVDDYDGKAVDSMMVSHDVCSKVP